MTIVATFLLLLPLTQTSPESAPRQGAAVTVAAEVRDAAALLRLAFDAGERMPLNPHARNKSKLQGVVVDACLKLGQPDQALAYAERIGDWRLGLAQASAAVFHAEQGNSKAAKECVSKAENFLKLAEKSETVQDWQRDRIRARIAQTLIQLDEPGEAARFEDGLAAAELAPVQSAKGRKLSPEELKARLEGVDTVVLNGNFEEIRSTLTACAKLFEQFYAQPDLRDSIQSKITSSWAKLPLQVRVEILMSMSEAALKVKDNAKALELVTLAQQQFQVAQWLTETEVAFIGELAKLRARAGDADRARRELEAGLKKYDEAEARIVNIYRASALRPVAEAWFVIGDRTRAGELYARALEAGMQNPNSRPRADDLCATACSMAVIGFQPDAAQFERMRAILAGLGDPW